MKKDSKNIIRLGVFVTFGLLLFIVAVYLIGNQNSLFRPSFAVSTYFENVNGLQPGNNVRYAGINVGSVVRIVILNDSTLRVDMNLDKKMQGVLKKDALATIGSDGLVGSMIINISPGRGLAPPVEAGEVLESYSRIATDEMMAKLGNTSETVALLSLNLLEISERINSGKGTLSMLLQDSLVAADIRLTMRNLRQAAYQMNLVGEELQLTASHLRQGRGLINTLLYDTTLSQDLRRLPARLDSLLFDETQPLLNELTSAAEHISTASGELNTILSDIKEPKSVVGTLLYDTLATAHLRHILANLDTSTVLLNENLEAMRHNFLFRKHFRKQAKKRDPTGQ